MGNLFVKLQSFAPYIVFSIVYAVFRLDTLGEWPLIACIYIAGTFAVFWEISTPVPDFNPKDDAHIKNVRWFIDASSRRSSLKNFIDAAWYGGPIASVLYGLAVSIFGGLIGEAMLYIF